MAFLYFKNTTTTGVWNDVTNWFTDNACTIQAANVPWVAGDSTYLGYDLTRSSASVTAEDAIFIDADIGDGLTITGTCDITTAGAGLFSNNNGITIYGGNFSGASFNNNGIINGGIFSGAGFNNENASIYGGTFTGDNFTNQGNATIYGGTFTGDNFSNSGVIYGGKFSGGSFSNTGSIYGGLFDIGTGLTMPIGTGGLLIDFSLLTNSLFLGGSSWNTGPWYEDYEGTIAWMGSVPWTDSSTETKNIFRGNSGELGILAGDISIDTTIGNSLNITGTCYIIFADDGSTNSELVNASGIYSGTFISDYMVNGGSIYGGTFTGNYFLNNTGYIYDGTFSGDYLSNENIIYTGTFTGNYFLNNTGGSTFGGTFSGDYITNSAYIYGGVFSGDNNTSNGTIYGGTFTGGGFYNYYIIYNGVFSGESFLNQNAANIFGGIYTGNNFVNSGDISGGSWLESGFLDIDIFDYSNGGPAPTITGQIRIRGTGSNPYPLDLASATGFMTLKIKGQDVLGAGLL